MLRNIAFVGPVNYNANKLCDYLNENKFKDIFLVTDEKDFYNAIIQIKQFSNTLTVYDYTSYPSIDEFEFSNDPDPEENRCIIFDRPLQFRRSKTESDKETLC
jgi:hypothetical protein